MTQTVADMLVGVLEHIGVKQIFALIGDSLNPLAEAVRSSSIEWIGVRHEEGAALAASGQAKLTGRLAVCAGTTGPGSTHLVAGLYEAARDHAPVLALSGDMPRKMQGVDYFQTTKPDLLFRDVSLYTETIMSPEQAPAVIHQAVAAAYAGRGVAHLTLPQDILSARSDGGVASVDTLQPRPEIAASAEHVARIASRIDAAGSVLIMCGNGCHGAAAELRALSDRLKAPLIHSVKGQDILPYDDPHWMGGIGFIGSKPVYNAVMSADLLLMVGTDYPYSNFLPNRAVVVQIDERPEVLGRRAPTALGVLGSARRRSNCSSIRSRRKPTQATGIGSRRSAAPGTASSTSRLISRAAPITSIHRQLPARSAISPTGTRSSCSIPALIRCGLPTGSGKADRSASSGRSTMVPSERRSGRPTASRRSTARGR
jgi:pyruvate dehydrogenase (quinone)